MCAYCDEWRLQTFYDQFGRKLQCMHNIQTEPVPVEDRMKADSFTVLLGCNARLIGRKASDRSCMNLNLHLHLYSVVRLHRYVNFKPHERLSWDLVFLFNFKASPVNYSVLSIRSKG